MATPFEQLLAPPGLALTAFPPTSRYAGVAIVRLTSATPGEGREIAYLQRRFVPSIDDHVRVGWRTFERADRLDRLANDVFGDPEAFWRLCDANGAMQPDELEKVGQIIWIGMPKSAGGMNV